MLILLIDDHPEILDSLSGFLRGLGHRTTCCTSARTGLAAMARELPDLVVTDLRMPDCDGIGLLSALEGLTLSGPRPPVAVMTAYADAATAIEALRRGAVDYLRKPIDVRELHQLVQRYDRQSGILPVATGKPQADGLVVAGPAFAGVVALADRLHRAAGIPCVIEAETGCGKELIARRIHHGGDARESRPFVALNCAAIAPGLFEAELFGYAPGSFTGGHADGAPGKLALAGNGTLFLDEIAELPADQQAKLLRVIEDRSWYPVGGSRLQRLEARVVCATNRPLYDLVRDGRFREDLLYRLKVGHVRIPPLRERRDEIIPLAIPLMASVRHHLDRGCVGITDEAQSLLCAHDWPGNVRQLRHVLEIAAISLDDDGRPLDASMVRQHLGPGTGKGTGPGTDARPPATASLAGEQPSPLFILPEDGFPIDEWQRRIIVAALERHHGSPVRTASYLGISRKVLYTLRRRYGLLPPGDGDDAE